MISQYFYTDNAIHSRKQFRYSFAFTVIESDHKRIAYLNPASVRAKKPQIIKYRLIVPACTAAVNLRIDRFHVKQKCIGKSHYPLKDLALHISAGVNVHADAAFKKLFARLTAKSGCVRHSPPDNVTPPFPPAKNGTSIITFRYISSTVYTVP